MPTAASVNAVLRSPGSTRYSIGRAPTREATLPGTPPPPPSPTACRGPPCRWRATPGLTRGPTAAFTADPTWGPSPASTADHCMGCLTRGPTAEPMVRPTEGLILGLTVGPTGARTRVSTRGLTAAATPVCRREEPCPWRARQPPLWSQVRQWLGRGSDCGHQHYISRSFRISSFMGKHVSIMS